ncbi:hypothetical protein DERP_009277 [Dermatophagoides pteronyssinus]|uniref:Uncharacterized protein n=1 Tax=Dermatophagoides pteronyssinus TaxID=6956 RepID=A0ABQ8ITN7_DERPT|nr:hypothetical protein DERP_009277 [Dermatophagoides pteronyssinus]
MSPKNIKSESSNSIGCSGCCRLVTEQTSLIILSAIRHASSSDWIRLAELPNESRRKNCVNFERSTPGDDRGGSGSNVLFIRPYLSI